ncbi:signal peptidase I [Streptomyces sp. NPDC088354]|uniref:signal peptidase I n=1 Tax=Streptomyces sp. NPDC088354 TaxID=3365856 RepID=UPI0038055152
MSAEEEVTPERRTAQSVDPGSTGKAPGARRRWWQELPVLVVVALLLSFLIKTFFVQAFSIPSDSMQNTLQRGDRVLVDKFTPWFGATPQRGEVVVFRDPGGWLDEGVPKESNVVLRGLRKGLTFIGLMPSVEEKDLIKRVIAVGGDTVECNRGEPLKVNGIPLNEPYIYPGSTPCDDNPVGTIKVPKDHLWVMGDHRDDSWDSRAHVNGPTGGFVPVKNVVGRAFTVAWPIPRWATLPVPATFHRDF